ncbi:MAG: PIG-L family deacetylase [Actinobacteria bacterium]|nr:MAG: PIG-L family deacetylase [Actinomycetota bacterium]
MAANDPGQPDPTVDTTFTSELETPRSALAIGAHPDDVEFGCGGLLAKWASDGCTIHHLICTDGSKGTWDPNADLAALAIRRREEQRQAAARLAGPHAGEVRFLGYVDGELESDLKTRGEVAKTIRELRPEVVLGHDPWKRYRLHPDHRHAGLLACEGIVASRDPHFFRDQGLDHHRPERLLLWEAEQPDHVENVSAFVDVKLHALAAHESQFESTMNAVDDAQLAAFDVRIRDRLADLGRPHGMESAELFKLISDL